MIKYKIGDVMKDIKMDTLSLCKFDKDNKYHMIFLKKILKDKTITERFQGFLPNLTKKYDGTIIGAGFFIADGDVLVGYIDIGNYNANEKAVYIRQTIDQDARGNGYGKRSLYEVCDFIFKEYPNVENIKARIAPDNEASIRMAVACGFTNIRDDYYGIENPYIKNNKIK